MTVPEPPSPTERNQLRRDAAAWFARMRGPNADADKREFDAWLAGGTQRLGAYNRAAEIWSLGKFLAEPEEPPVEPAAAEVAARRKRPMFIAMSACAACVLIFGGWLTLPELGYPARDTRPAIADPGRLLPEQPVQLATAPGQDRTVRLSDGSVVSLRPDTKLAVTFGKAERRLRLARGAARFEVAHERRPFVVAAGSGTVTARGTIFDVSVAAGNHVTVKLFRGSVDVAVPTASRSPVQPARMVTRLAPGDHIDFADTGFRPQPPPASLPRTRYATMDLDHARLADLLSAANRNSPVQISLGDPGLAGLQVSGLLRVNDPEKLAVHLATVLDLKIDHPAPSRIVLRRR